jgi:hypothetical protein
MEPEIKKKKIPMVTFQISNVTNGADIFLKKISMVTFQILNVTNGAENNKKKNFQW